MKKSISYILTEVFKDKAIFTDIGFSNLESEVFYHLMQGHSISHTAEQLNLSSSLIKKIKDRRFHLVPQFIRRRLSYLSDNNISLINQKLSELELLIAAYFNFFEQFKIKRIGELELSSRVVNSLTAAGIKSIQDLIVLNDKDLLKIKNLGRKSINEIKAELSKLNLSLRE